MRPPCLSFTPPTTPTGFPFLSIPILLLMPFRNINTKITREVRIFSPEFLPSLVRRPVSLTVEINVHRCSAFCIYLIGESTPHLGIPVYSQPSDFIDDFTSKVMGA
jgi:hypothetical protein